MSDPIAELAQEDQQNAAERERQRHEALVTFRQILASPVSFDKTTVAEVLRTLGVSPAECVAYVGVMKERRQLAAQVMTEERNSELQSAIGKATQATHEAVRNRIKELVDMIHDEKLLLDLYTEASVSAGHGDGAEWARAQWVPVHAATAAYQAAHVASNEAKAKLERLQIDYGILFGDGDEADGKKKARRAGAAAGAAV